MSWLLKIHLATVTLTLVGFVLRGYWMIRGSPRLKSRAARTLPHINDTLLLATGITMVVLLGWYPWQQPWLGAKLLLLLAYILLGTIALKRGKNLKIRVTAWVLALCVFGYLVMVARFRTPFPFGADVLFS